MDIKEKLQKLTEDKLRKNIIIPLLKVLGFEYIEDWCGPSEDGKDVLYAKKDQCVMDRDSSCDNIKNYTRESLVRTLRTETSYFLDAHDSCRKCEINQSQDIVCGGFCRFSNSYAKGIKP